MKTILQSLKARFSEKPIRIEVERVKSTEIRLREWQKQPHLVEMAKNLFAQPAFKLAIDCLQSEHPCHTVFSALGTNPNDRMVHQAKIEGYEICLNTLLALAQSPKTNAPLEATFEAPEVKRK